MIPGSGGSAGEGISYPLQYSSAPLVAQLIKNLPAVREAWVQSLGWEDPLEKGKATHSSILAWRFPWTVHCIVHGVAESQTQLNDFHFHLFCKLWCWRGLLRVPLAAKRSTQSIPKEINPAYSLEGLMLKFKLRYFGHLMRRADSLKKTLMLGKIEGVT